MRILFIHQYFRTPDEGGGIRTYYLAKALIQQGHSVELITAHNFPAYVKKDVEGITVHYLPVYYENRLGFIARIYAFLKFIFLTLKIALPLKSIDRSYVVTTPLTVGFIALLIKKIRSIPYIIEVGDLWPDAPVQMGVIKNKILINLLFWLEKTIYKEAEIVVPYSSGIEQSIHEKAPSVKTVTITNMADCNFFYPTKKSTGLEKKYLVEGKFVISYLGTIGKANHLEYLLDVSYQCTKQGLHNIHFIIAGEGGELPYIKALVKKKGLKNISFFPFTNKTGVKEILNITDACYISFINKPVMQTGCPNKFFDAIASGKLIIVNMKGWIAEAILQHECGFYTDPKCAEEFPTLILPFLTHTDLLVKYQNNARILAEKKYSVSRQLSFFTSLFS